MINTDKKLLVFGAAGKTGSEVIRQALKNGILIRAAVRSPDMFPADLASNPEVEVVHVDVSDLSTVARAIEGVDLIFAALGYKGSPSNPLLPPFVREVVRSMRRLGVKRFVYQAAGLSSEPNKPNSAIVSIIRGLIAPMLRTHGIWQEHDEVIRFLVEEVDDLDWTVTRAGVLSEGKSKGKLVVSDKRGTSVVYQDLATFSLDTVLGNSYARTCPYLRYEKN